MKSSLSALRKCMEQWGWDVAIVSGSDPHGSEYTPQRWRLREYVTGFTGSAGTVVVTADSAGLWTDSRYFLQAETQLSGSGVTLHKVQPGAQTWQEWVVEYCRMNPGVVGFDGFCHSFDEIDKLKTDCPGSIFESRPNYIDQAWHDRPSLPNGEVWVLKQEYCGREASDKLADLRKFIKQNDCSSALISDLSEIAWLLNIRSSDVLHTPVVISYCLVEQNRVLLFADQKKFGNSVLAYFESLDNIEILPYESIETYLPSYLNRNPKTSIVLDSHSLNYQLCSIFRNTDSVRIVDKVLPISLSKSVKNQTEIDGFIQAYIYDGVAQTRFFMWLEEMLAKGADVTEADAAARMTELRKENPLYIDDSFGTISAYGANGAIPHYDYNTAQTETKLQPKGLYLIDSGAHYQCGTTDITRTVPLGPLTDKERFDYTIVLKSMIDLSMAVFPQHTTGARLDCLIREPMWRYRLNYGHGSGHGVGHLLSVHEGPQGIRQDSNPEEFRPGIIMSNEPGIYITGQHGVRHENMLLCIEDSVNEYGTWYRFRTLTCTYIDTTCLAPDILSQEELDWVKDYNKACIETLKPFLKKSEIEWLKSK